MREKMREQFDLWFMALSTSPNTPEGRRSHIMGMILFLRSMDAITDEEDDFLTQATLAVFV